MRLRPLALILCALSASAALAGPAAASVATTTAATAVATAAAAKPDCRGLPAHAALPVVDAANVVEAEPEAWLNADLMLYHLSGHEAIVAVTVTDLGGDDVSSYATRLFDCWGIGDEKADNGVLILVAMRERRVRIELGAGLDGRLTDGRLEAAIATMTAPLRSKDVATALRSAAGSLVHDLGGELPDTKANGGAGGVPSMISPDDDVVDTPPVVAVPFLGEYPDGAVPFDSSDEESSGLTALVVIGFVVALIVVAVRTVAGIGSSIGGGSVWRGGFPGSYGGGGGFPGVGGPWGSPSMWHHGSWHDASGSSFGSSGSSFGSSSGSSGSSGSVGSSGSSSSFGGGSSGGGGASGSW